MNHQNHNNTFKDKCDICNKFDYCRGFNNKVLCESCLSKEKSTANFINKEIQLTIFDFI